MKFPYPSLIRQMSGRSSEVQDGDSAMTLPPVMQPVLEMFSPIAKFGSIPSPAEDTFMDYILVQQIGAQIATSFSSNTMKAGRWNVTLNVGFQFAGTQSANLSGIVIIDDVATVRSVSRFQHQPGQLTQTVEFPILLLKDGFFFQATAAATVALDLLLIGAMIHARRIF